MAIVQEDIEIKIQSLLDETADMELEKAKKKFQSDLAKIIVDAIKSATITVKPGIIQVAGSPSSQANVAPILIENSIT